jgi:hypothetical protein
MFIKFLGWVETEIIVVNLKKKYKLNYWIRISKEGSNPWFK